MFNDIGKKIKILAQVLCWVGIIASVIIALIMFVTAEAFISSGLLFLIAGPLCSWINSFFVYGFGELIEKITKIEINTRNKEKSKENPKSFIEDNKIIVKNDKVKELLEQGLIEP